MSLSGNRKPLRYTQPLFSRVLTQGILVSAAACLFGCGSHEPATKSPAAAVHVSGIARETVKTVSRPETVELSGTVRARISAMVSARVAGSVTLLKVREGDRVKKGQILAQLEAQENLAQAAQASSAVDEARRGVDEALAQKKLADATFERYQKLFKEQAVSRQEFEVRQTEHEVASQAAARAEARLRQAHESSRAAAAMADYTRIAAPISGIITSRQIGLGATVFPAQPLFTIEDEGSYQLELAVPESFAAHIRVGTPLRVTLDALSSDSAARVAEIVPAADPGSRTFIARVNLGTAGVRSGMFGRGTVALGASKPVITVPRAAVIEQGALTSLWVVDREKTARLRLVKTGREIDGRIEILSGLSDGEHIATAGIAQLRDGAKVD